MSPLTPPSYLLDTDACIALINSDPMAVRSRLMKCLDRGELVYVSAISPFELWYGVEKSTLKQSNRIGLEGFLSRTLRLLPFDEEDARAAGVIRASLELRGTPIGAYDLLIGGQALRRDMTLVTANVKEFRRIAGLQWEDWAKL
jgi:tRNA(fMet)-specific endonuclease VapC